MKLHECKYGTMVVNSPSSNLRSCGGDRVGFVVGLERNNIGETIPTIAWDTGQTYGCHHANLVEANEETIAAAYASRAELG